MIRVEFIYESDVIRGFEITGHADYDEYGKDLVCAAVSILAYTTANSLEAHDYEFDFDDDGDMMKLNVVNPSHDSTVILNTLSTGIWTLEQSYGDFVQSYTNID